ncbi:MFS transporter [Brevibacillus humidisoli]|uniref:MFS transporter n=1 Tax=Brevibacillus humidisoli TaxID=2895522 RepID=UPI001E4B071B|nr:MFS transporter [Brevibacillus humidisoli]UFJ41587.1 MFS transporter [Brevibacillus humidisoli]
MVTLWKQPVFRRLYSAQVINTLGHEFTFIAVIGLLNELSGSGLSFAAGTVFRLLPYVITSLFSGALLENWDKRRVMLTVNLLSGVLVSLYFWVTEPAHLWVAFLLLAAINICSAFFQPAMQVALVESVPIEQRLAANSLLQGTKALLIIVGQGIAAVLVSFYSYRFNFLLDAACYLLSFFLLLRLPLLKQRGGQQDDSIIRRLREGLRYMWGETEIRHIIYLQMAERIAGANYILLMFYILQERKEPLHVFGLLDIPLGLGGVLAGYLIGRWADKLHLPTMERAMGLSMILVGGGIFFLFHVGPIWVIAVSSLLLSFASFSVIIMSVTRLQVVADARYLARVFSLREMFTMTAFSIGCLAVGFGGEAYGSQAIATGLAVLGMLSGLCWLLAARHRARRRQAADHKTAARSG